MGVAVGLTRLAQGDAEVVRLVRGQRVGLLAHPASIDATFTHAEHVVVRAGAKLAALFGAEHGYAGEAQYMVGVASTPGPVPVYSLYGDSFDELSPKPAWLRGLDAVVVDLQDVGSRYYTFVWSMALMLRACAAAGVRCIVLDRPNPLGGSVMEGAPQRRGQRSFVGLYDVPVRHGLTIGEIAQLVRAYERLPEQALQVVAMEGWQRAQSYDQTGLPWVLPSPNMPTLDTARVYPGGCLLEGTNLSEGRGTTRPFEFWGAPFVDGEALAREVQGAGARLRPCRFEPGFDKFAGAICRGVQVHVTDPAALRSYALYLRMIAHVARTAPGDFRFRTEPYEYVSDRPAIDLLTGGPEFRGLVDSRGAVDDYLAAQEPPLADFAAERAPYLLYH